MTAEDLISSLQLQPHPEGGWFRETVRLPASVPVLRDGVPGLRSPLTRIHYLLKAGERSRFHRIDADEAWLWLGGDGVDVLVLHEDGALEILPVREHPVPGTPQPPTVPAGRWFAARPAPGAAYGLSACVVSPGFEFAGFELADAAQLIARWPQHAELIAEFTGPADP